MSCNNCDNCNCENSTKEITLHGSELAQRNRVSGLEVAMMSVQDYPTTWNILNDIKQEILAQLGGENV